MKLIKGLVLSETSGETVGVTVGEARKRANVMLRMNRTAGVVVRALKEDRTEAELIAILQAECSASEEQAKNSVANVLETLRERALLDE